MIWRSKKWETAASSSTKEKAWNDLVHRTQTHVTAAVTEEEEKEYIKLWILCFCTLKAGRWHRQDCTRPATSRSRHSSTVCRLITVLRTRHQRCQNIPFWDDRLTADTPRVTDATYPVRPQSGCGHIASGHKQKADLTMISTTCCYYYVLYICLVGWYAAGISPGRKKRNCFQFYYSNSPLTKSSPSELYHAFLLLANYVCDVAVSQAIRERKLRAMWSFGATFGSNYPLFWNPIFTGAQATTQKQRACGQQVQGNV